MSTRFRIIHHARIANTGIEYRADIVDSEYSGSVQTKYAQDTFFDWDYPKINERDPFESPLQGSIFKIDLHVGRQDDSEFNLINDIVDSDESRFQIEFYIDGDHKWSGNVLTDMMTYPEAPRPWSATIKAKDLASIEGKYPDLGLISERTRLSELVALCLSRGGFSLPIRSYTNLTNTQLSDTSQDFLYGLYHDNRAFYDGQEQMDAKQILQEICRAYNLIIRQSDARWIIEQLPAVAKGDDVQFDYDSNGLNPVSSTPNRTIVVDQSGSFLLPNGSVNKITGALKEAEVEYNHKTPIFNIPTEDVEYLTNPFGNNDKFSRSIEDVGGYRFAGTLEAEAELSGNNPAGSIVEAYFIVRVKDAGTERTMDNSGDFTSADSKVSITLTGSGSTVTGDFDMDISEAVGPGDVIEIEFLFAEMVDDVGTGVTVEETRYSNINTYIFQAFPSIRDDQATLKNVYRRTGSYSVTEEIPTKILGSGPTPRSIGSPSTAANGWEALLYEGDFIIRGESAGESGLLGEISLRERVSMRRNALRNLRAKLWMKYSPEYLIEYDGNTWFFLGGNFEAKKSRWNSNILLLDYGRDDANDVFNTYVESGGSPKQTTLTGSSTGGETGITDHGALDGLDDPSDHPWAMQTDASNAGDAATIQSNIGLKNGNADLDLNTIAINGSSLVDSSRNVNANSVDINGTNVIDSGRNVNANSVDINGTNFVDSSRNVSANNLEVEGTINYVNEQNLQVEDKTITVNKNGTDASAEGAGIIIERPGGNKNLLWDSTDGYTFDDDITYEQSIVSASFAEAGGLFTGYKMSQNEFKAELIRANELRVKAFVAEISAALYGEDILTKSRGVLSRTFTIPSVGNTATLYVEDLEGQPDTQVFEANDWVRMKVVDRSGGGLQAFNVWGRVSSYTDLSGGEQSWTFTRESGGAATSGNVVNKGSVAIDYGTSGDAVIVRSVIGSNTPRDTQLTWTTDPTDPSNYSIVTRIGILDDIANASGAGFYGENFYATESVLIGDLSEVGDHFKFSGDTLTWQATNTTLDADGNLTATNADLSGKITATSGDIAGWDILTSEIKKEETGVGSIVLDSANNLFTMGADFSGTIKDVLNIGADSVTPSVHSYDSGVVSNFSVSYSAGFVTHTGTSNTFSSGTANKPLTVSYDLDTSSFTWNNINYIEFHLQGRVGTDNWTFLETKKFENNVDIQYSTRSSRSFISSTQSYDDFRILVIINQSGTGNNFGSLDITNIDYEVSNSTLAINSDGVYQKFGNNIERFLTGGGDPTGGSGSPVSTVFGRTGDITAQQSDYDSFFVPKSGGDFTDTVNFISTNVNSHIGHGSNNNNYFSTDDGGFTRFRSSDGATTTDILDIEKSLITAYQTIQVGGGGGHTQILETGKYRLNVSHSTALAFQVENTGSADILAKFIGGNVIADKIGIGTDSPARELDVNGSIAVKGNRFISTGGSVVYMGDVDSSDGTNDVQIRAGGSDVIRILESDLSVGIGTTNPSYKLHVADNVGIDGDIILTGGNTADVTRAIGNSRARMAFISDSNNNDSIQLRVHDHGVGYNYPVEFRHNGKTVFSDDVRFSGSSEWRFAQSAPTWNSGVGLGIQAGHTGGGSILEVWNGAGTNVFNIYGNGDLDATYDIYANDYWTQSDRRIKEDLKLFDNPLSLFDGIEGMYSFLKDGKRQAGLVAQEVEKGHSLLVGSQEHDDLDEILTLSAYTIGSLAVAGVKGLIGRTDIMKDDIDENEQKIERLKSRVHELEQECQQLREKVA